MRGCCKRLRQTLRDSRWDGVYLMHPHDSSNCRETRPIELDALQIPASAKYVIENVHQAYCAKQVLSMCARKHEASQARTGWQKLDRIEGSVGSFAALLGAQ